MNQEKQNQQNAQALVANLSQKDEIDQKCEYYKSIIVTYANLCDAIDKKIESSTDDYEKCKLTIEKLDTEDRIFSMKGFFEMWLERSKDYDKKFEIISKECNDRFDEIESLARDLALKNPMLKMAMANYDAQEEKPQRVKNEYYALLKYEVLKANPLMRKEEYSVGK
jgi:hypothetical protein